VLDKIKQQLNSIRIIWFVFSLKILPYPSHCLIPTFFPTHHYSKGELPQPPQSLCCEVYLTATQNMSISKHFLKSQLMLPSHTCCIKASFSSIFAPLLHGSSRMRARTLLANLLLFNFALQGNQCISITHTYVTTYQSRQERQSSVHP